MSMWKACEFWDAPSATEGEVQQGLPGLSEKLNVRCSYGCLCTLSLPENAGSDVIICGTWDGTIRGFHPEGVPYAAEHLLFERALDAAVLQIETGNFLLSASGGSFQLAVLHPDKLALYFYGQGNSNDSRDLFHLRSYKLRASAYSMVSGSFGGITGRRMLGALTMDGRLTIIDQETVMETPPLEDFLFPGPLCYYPVKDIFIAGTSCWTADAYTYSEFASKAGVLAAKATQDVRMRKAWSYNCGEALISISHTGTLQESVILLLGERHLFCLDSNGAMRSIRRLDYPACLVHAYPAAGTDPFNMIIASTTQTLCIYKDLVPKWTTQMPCSVVDVKTAKIAGMDGIIVTLSEDGHVTAWYLGTDPKIFEAKSFGSTRQFDEEELKMETSRLAESIRQFEEEPDNPPPKTQSSTAAIIEVEEFGPVGFEFHPKSRLSQRVPATRSRIAVSPVESALSGAQVEVQVVPPLVAIPPAIMIGGIANVISVEFAVQNDLSVSPVSLTGRVVLRCEQNGISHVQCEAFCLPLGLVAQVATISKKGTLKLDFEVSPDPLRLEELFPDFGPHEQMGLTMDFYGTGQVTILISKKQETKIRIQSDDSGLLLTVCEEVRRRMTMAKPNSTITCVTDFPSSYLQDVLAQKAQLLKDYEFLRNDLEDWTKQLFAVEKRFLARLKDRDAAIVYSLEALLETTQEKIIEAIDNLEITQNRLTATRKAASATVSLLHWLVRTNNRKLSIEEIHLLELVCSAATEEDRENLFQSWDTQVRDASKFYVETYLPSDALYNMQDVNDLPSAAGLLKYAYQNQLGVNAKTAD